MDLDYGVDFRHPKQAIEVPCDEDSVVEVRGLRSNSTTSLSHALRGFREEVLEAVR